MNVVVTTTVGFWLIPGWVSVSNVKHSTYQSLNLCMDVSFFHFRIYCLLSDEIFPLKSSLLRPYPEKKRDLRTTGFYLWTLKSRRVFENTFGIWTARWRIFLTFIIALWKIQRNMFWLV